MDTHACRCTKDGEATFTRVNQSGYVRAERAASCIRDHAEGAA
jgi:hypothetical protein